MIATESKIETVNNTINYLTMIDKVKKEHGIMNSVSKNMESFEGLILKYGKQLKVTDNSFPTRYRGPIKNCFQNAYNLAERFPGKYYYAEGFSNGIIPVHHAFCVNKDLEVIDVTWKSGVDYVGIIFNLDAVRNNLMETGYYGTMIDDWKNHWPLLTGKVDIKTVIETKFYI